MKEYEARSPEELRWGDYLGHFGRQMGWSFRIGGDEDREDEGAGLAGQEGASGIADEGSHSAGEEGASGTADEGSHLAGDEAPVAADLHEGDTEEDDEDGWRD